MIGRLDGVRVHGTDTGVAVPHGLELAGQLMEAPVGPGRIAKRQGEEPQRPLVEDPEHPASTGFGDGQPGLPRLPGRGDITQMGGGQRHGEQRRGERPSSRLLGDGEALLCVLSGPGPVSRRDIPAG